MEESESKRETERDRERETESQRHKKERQSNEKVTDIHIPTKHYTDSPSEIREDYTCSIAKHTLTIQ